MTPPAPDAGGPAGAGGDPDALPDFTASRAVPTELAPPPAPVPTAAPAPRRALPAWAIVLLVLVVLAGQVGALTVVVAGALSAVSSLSDGDEPVTITDPMPAADPGTVLDADGAEVTDGTGTWERPATIGEHAFAWPTWDGGTVTARVTALDPDATLPAAGGEDLLEEEHTLLVATLDLHYAGPGQFQPAIDLWPWLETDLAYHQDMLPGLAPDALPTVGGVDGGETATVRLGFVVPDRELDSARLSLETSDGDPLYYGLP